MPSVDRTLSLVQQQTPEVAWVPGALVSVIRPLVTGGFEVARVLLGDYETLEIGRGAGCANLQRDGGSCVLRIDDAWLSASHLRLWHEAGGWTAEDCRSRNGTLLNRKPLSRGTVHDRDVLEAGSTVLVFRSCAIDPRTPALMGAEALARCPAGVRSLSPKLAGRFSELTRVARSTLSVVLTGATGVGKEVCARAVHQLSGRDGPFVALNCGAMPASLIESELFGFEKGAFSGATQARSGIVRASSGGTLFLDEIGELPPALQTRLLRVLQEREVLPLGASSPVPVDLRVVCATHHDLESEVREGQFREDLWARLSGYLMTLPPLRDRIEDLGLVLENLRSRLSFGAMTRAAIATLCLHSWPRNIRELAQTLHRARVLSDDGTIDVNHLGDGFHAVPDETETLATRLLKLMREHHGNVSQVARAMGKHRPQIDRYCKKFGIDPADYRP